jgi:hypothetical protein
MQNTKISCRGGLALNSTSQELLGMPGYATRLQNFECTTAGGYRRINGFAPFGDVAVPGSGVIKGIHIFHNSIIVARGTALYHTFDTTTWVQINKEVSGVDYATIELASEVPMNASVTKVRFDSYSNGTGLEDQIVLMVNEYDHPMYFKITGTDHTTATYTFTYVDDVTTGAPDQCKYVSIFEDQAYITGNPDTPSTVFVSTIFDPLTWNGTNSLQISTANPTTGLYPFRDDMVVFCENSIFRLAEVNTGNPALIPITKNIGCVHGDTIQEIGGDLVYLAPDGIRTLAATDRIDDVELSTVSGNIQPLIDQITEAIDTYEFHSVVLRKSSQYRLYYQKAGTGTVVHQGIIGTLVPDNGNLGWNWSTTKRLSAKNVLEGLYGGEYVSLMSTKDDGILYQHNVGSTFDSDPIISTYSTPFFDMGDPSIRKNMHSVRAYIKTEGSALINFNVKYTGKNNELAHQPLSYSITDFAGNSAYGEATYNGSFVYNAPEINDRVNFIEGSGFTVALSYFSSAMTDDPFNIQGFNLNFIASGKV